MKKVLIICPFSYPSACGIWKRVSQDAEALVKNGFEVTVFSSNIIKGTNQTSGEFEEYNGIKIYRFPVKFKLGGTSMFFFFYRKFREINADIIHVHGYRHPHSLFGTLMAKLNGKIALITPHAPFEKDSRRSIIMKAFDACYDLFIGWWQIRLYKKVIMTTHWEEKYLKRLGASNKKLKYIPNGVSSFFFENKNEVQKKIAAGIRSRNEPARRQAGPGMTLLYMGRLDPVKRLEWILEAARKFPELNFKIVGPLSGYKDLKSNLKNLEVITKQYTENEFVHEAFMSDIYIIPSARESFGITALEAMSQGCIVLFSRTRGAEEYIVHGKNGFIFEDEDDLFKMIELVANNINDLKDLKVAALETAESYNIEASKQKIIEIYKSL